MKLAFGRRAAWTAAPTVAVALAAAGIAYASIPDSSGVIHGCYATKDGTFRIIDPSLGQSCDPKREGAVNWNQQGPQGVQGPPGPAGSTHGYETNTIAKVPGTMALTDVISIGGVPDGSYIVSAQINAFSLKPGQFIYCGLYDGTNQTAYTIEDETSANLDVADPVIVGALTLSGGSSTVHVVCQATDQMDTYSALALTKVAALN